MMPEISIIIPTLNEAGCLPRLLNDLVRQQGLAIEVVVVDGGSTDATCQVAEDVLASSHLSGVCLVCPSGRGRQLNAGASAARSDWLLFLHADSRLHDTSQLLKALEFMRSHQQRQATDASAGRFPLRFDASPAESSLGLLFCEVKARLGRPGCIHGDQGLLLPRSFFRRVGPFREDLPVMEDTALAEAIRAAGQWLLLPGEIETSVRRFQAEGFRERQTLNALMMNFLAIGWLDFFSAAPDIYRQQDRTRPLQLWPFFRLLKNLLSTLPLQRRWAIWLATGGYVRSQAWQLGLALDCRRAYRRAGRTVPGGWLNFFDRWFDPLTNHGLGRLVTALLVMVWFSRCLKEKAEESQPGNYI